MTTIVYDHRRQEIAVDGRTTGGSLIATDAAQKHKYHGNEVWFFCGTRCDADNLLGMEHNTKPEVQPDCTALRVCAKGVYLVNFNGDYCAHTKLDYSYSLGSGCDFALAALDLGKTAEEAAEYTKTRDTGTGGFVWVFDIETMSFTKGHDYVTNG